MVVLEVATFNLPSALIAANSGADRIEFCKDRSTGGITPDFSALVELRSSVKIPTFVMIRPRSGDFVYTREEVDDMERSILRCKPHADGLVFGILKHDNTIDKETCIRLLELAHPLPCTFHRAFDETINLRESLETLIECGFSSVLTSGGASNALKGKDMLFNLIQQASDRINVIAGGGVRSTNLEQMSHLQPSAFHTAAVLDDGEIADAAEVQTISRSIREMPIREPVHADIICR